MISKWQFLKITFICIAMTGGVSQTVIAEPARLIEKWNYDIDSVEELGHFLELFHEFYRIDWKQVTRSLFHIYCSGGDGSWSWSTSTNSSYTMTQVVHHCISQGGTASVGGHK